MSKVSTLKSNIKIIEDGLVNPKIDEAMKKKIREKLPELKKQLEEAEGKEKEEKSNKVVKKKAAKKKAVTKENFVKNRKRKKDKAEEPKKKAEKKAKFSKNRERKKEVKKHVAKKKEHESKKAKFAHNRARKKSHEEKLREKINEIAHEVKELPAEIKKLTGEAREKAEKEWREKIRKEEKHNVKKQMHKHVDKFEHGGHVHGVGGFDNPVIGMLFGDEEDEKFEKGGRVTKSILNTSGTYSCPKGNSSHLDAGTELHIKGDYGAKGLWGATVGGVKKEFIIPYKDVITEKLEKGGKIKNQYEGKTAEEVWNDLTPEQRTHFLEDHQDLIGDNIPAGAKNIEYHKLNNKVKEVFKEHVEHGQYALGGGIGSFFGKIGHHTKKAYEGAKEGYGKAKGHVETKIHEKKKDIALDVIEKTYENHDLSQKQARAVKIAGEIVAKTYASGGKVESKKELFERNRKRAKERKRNPEVKKEEPKSEHKPTGKKGKKMAKGGKVSGYRALGNFTTTEKRDAAIKKHEEEHPGAKTSYKKTPKGRWFTWAE